MAPAAWAAGTFLLFPLLPSPSLAASGRLGRSSCGDAGGACSLLDHESLDGAGRAHPAAQLLQGKARTGSLTVDEANASTRATSESNASATAAWTGSAGSWSDSSAPGFRKVSADFVAGSAARLHERAVEVLDVRKAVAELIATMLLVFFGCGSVMSAGKQEGSAWVLQVSLTFGLAITVLTYALGGHYSCAQINSAVTIALVIYGRLGAMQGLMNVLGQLAGSVLGAALLKAMYPPGKNRTGGLGANRIAEGWSPLEALLGELAGAFLLVLVVFQTAVDPAAAGNTALAAPVAIGLSVFLAHSLLVPVDGCSINPARSFGPAFVEALTGAGKRPFKHMWVFWIGPLLGAAAATGVYVEMSSPERGLA